MTEARFDLDLADFAEVRRRILEPVVGSLFRPGELRGSDVVLGTAADMPGAHWTQWAQPSRGEPSAQIFVPLWCFDGSFAYLLGDAAFSRIDATSVAVDWADLVTVHRGGPRQSRLCGARRAANRVLPGKGVQLQP